MASPKPLALAKPASTRPGPTSKSAVGRFAFTASMHSRQRTGLVRLCEVQARASLDYWLAPREIEEDGKAGGRKAMSCRPVGKRALGFTINGLCHGPATGSCDTCPSVRRSQNALPHPTRAVHPRAPIAGVLSLPESAARAAASPAIEESPTWEVVTATMPPATCAAASSISDRASPPAQLRLPR